MLLKNRWLLLAALSFGLAVAFVSGCSKYDGLERNMQYVSDELLRADVQEAWRQVSEAHSRWTAAGGGRDKGNAAYLAYEDAYARYAVVYNELMDRRGVRQLPLRSATEALPPAPPGMAQSKPTPAVRPTTTAPQSHELKDAVAPRSQAEPAEEKPVAAVATPGKAPVTPEAPDRQEAANPAQGTTYVIQPGDTLRVIAKRHGVTEKQLRDANNLANPDKLAAGKSILLPGS